MRKLQDILQTEAGKVGIATVGCSALLFVTALATGSLLLVIFGLMVVMTAGVYTIGLMTLEDDYWTLALLFVFPLICQIAGAYLLVKTGGVPY